MKKLLSTFAIAVVVFFAGCKKDTYVPLSTVCPVIISTNPANTATNVPLNQVITATFNEKMNPLTITQASFTLQGGGNVSGILSYNESNTTMSFTPVAPLSVNTTYTATVVANVKDSFGNALQANYVWTFSTGAVLSPVVIWTDPLNGATGVVLNKVINAAFNMAMDPTTINGTNFTVKQGLTLVTGTVSYNNTIASFTPTSNLTANTTYSCTITTGAKNVSGTPISANYVWSFTTGSTTGPTVISTDPANNATGVALNKIVNATFSSVMDPSTLTTTTFTLKQGIAPVSGSVSYSGSTASFTSTTLLLPGTVYTATITTGARNPSGEPLANNYVWTFTTLGTNAPTVISTDPANNATGVPLNKIVLANFSTAMDPLTITSATFTLKQGTNSVSGTISYSGTTASFTPSANLTAGATYTATITTGAKNTAGTPIANNYVWTFTTGTAVAPTVTSTDPTNSATGVALNKVIAASFSVTMDPLTITTSTFTLSLGTNSVTGTVSYSGTTATFTPSVNLLSGNTYTATITTGAKDLAGTPLANNYVWTFSTVAPTGPTAPNLASVARFGIIAGVGVSNDAGYSVINNMDVGIYPGDRSSVTGFPPAKINNGAIYAADDVTPAGTAAMLKQAKLDLTAAYNYAAGASNPAPATVSGDLGGKTLAPGIYTSTSTLMVENGDLTLDAKGDANAVWIFQVASAFTTVGGSGGNIILSGGAQAANIYWQVGSSATIGGYTNFYGNILAYTSITMGGYATATGRLLAINAAVVMTSTDTINKP